MNTVNAIHRLRRRMRSAQYGVAALISWHGAAMGQSPATMDADFRAAAVHEVFAEQVVWDNAAINHWELPDVVVNQATMIIPGVAAMRATIGERDFLALSAAGRIYLLGGFVRNDLVAGDSLLSTIHACAANLMAHAECLGLMSDPNGARQVVVPYSGRAVGTTQRDSVIAAWRRVQPTRWPADTTGRADDGTTVVVLTLLSRDLGNYDQAWEPIAYAFVLRGDHLLTWSVRKGPSFGT